MTRVLLCVVLFLLAACGRDPVAPCTNAATMLVPVYAINVQGDSVRVALVSTAQCGGR